MDNDACIGEQSGARSLTSITLFDHSVNTFVGSDHLAYKKYLKVDGQKASGKKRIAVPRGCAFLHISAIGISASGQNVVDSVTGNRL